MFIIERFNTWHKCCFKKVCIVSELNSVKRYSRSVLICLFDHRKWMEICHHVNGALLSWIWNRKNNQPNPGLWNDLDSSWTHTRLRGHYQGSRRPVHHWLVTPSRLVGVNHLCVYSLCVSGLIRVIIITLNLLFYMFFYNYHLST